jgi:hypothetical protein
MGCWARLVQIAEDAAAPRVEKDFFAWQTIILSAKLIFSKMEAVNKDSGIEQRVTEIMEVRVTEIVEQVCARDREALGTGSTAANEGSDAGPGANRLATFHADGAC